jgi:hypothetical protein
VSGKDWPVRAAQVVVVAVGVAAGLATLATVRRSPAYAIGGPSGWDVLLGSAAGWSLLVAGAVALHRPARRPFGITAVLASWAWFAAQWNTPGAGSAAAFTAGMLVSSIAPVLVADAGLRYPDRRAGGLAAGALAAGFLVAAGPAGVVPALFLDPSAGGCSNCPPNLLLIQGRPRVAEGVGRAGLYAGVVCLALLAAVLT